MSGVMEEAERFGNMGLISIKDTCLCANHFSDKYVRKYIRENSQLGYCNYCKKEKNVISLEDFMFYFMKIVTYFYTDAAEFMSYDSSEGGYLGTTCNSYELFEEFYPGINNYELEQDIRDSIVDKAWASPDKYYETDGEIMMYNWNYFKDIVKHKARYLFYNSRTFQDDIYKFHAHSILKQVSKGVKKLKLLTVLPPNTSLYRCRQHDDKTSIKKASEIAAPPTECALYPNRMSPAGISMFYGAFELKIAKLEVLDPCDTEKKHLTSVIFRNKEPLYLIDFTKIPTINLFDPKQLKDYYLITFLHDFIKDLSQPIHHNNKIHIEYVPTQVLTEFFRYIHPHHKKSIDGIIYPSSKDKKGKAVVLFMDNKESLERLEFQEDSLKQIKIDFSKYSKIGDKHIT